MFVAWRGLAVTAITLYKITTGEWCWDTRYSVTDSYTAPSCCGRRPVRLLLRLLLRAGFPSLSKSYHSNNNTVDRPPGGSAVILQYFHYGFIIVTSGPAIIKRRRPYSYCSAVTRTRAPFRAAEVFKVSRDRYCFPGVPSNSTGRVRWIKVGRDETCRFPCVEREEACEWYGFDMTTVHQVWIVLFDKGRYIHTVYHFQRGFRTTAVYCYCYTFIRALVRVVLSFFSKFYLKRRLIGFDVAPARRVSHNPFISHRVFFQLLSSLPVNSYRAQVFFSFLSDPRPYWSHSVWSATALCRTCRPDFPSKCV